MAEANDVKMSNANDEELRSAAKVGDMDRVERAIEAGASVDAGDAVRGCTYTARRSPRAHRPHVPVPYDSCSRPPYAPTSRSRTSPHLTTHTHLDPHHLSMRARRWHSVWQHASS